VVGGGKSRRRNFKSTLFTQLSLLTNKAHSSLRG
jgi:hypothetical protein